MHFAEPRRVVAVVLQDGPHGAGALWDQRVVAGIAGRELGDDAIGNRMVVSSGDQRRAGRRAECRGVVHVVAEPAIGEPLEGGGLDRPAECAARAKAHVIGKDQQNIGRAGGSLDLLRKVGRGILDSAADLAPEGRFGLGQDLFYLLCLRRGGGRRNRRCRDKGSGAEQQRAALHSFALVRGVGFTIILAHDFSFRK